MNDICAVCGEEIVFGCKLAWRHKRPAFRWHKARPKAGIRGEWLGASEEEDFKAMGMAWLAAQDGWEDKETLVEGPNMGPPVAPESGSSSLGAQGQEESDSDTILLEDPDLADPAADDS